MPIPEPLPRLAQVDPKVARLVTHGTYQVATGKWARGERLPSVRRAAERFGVDARTVLKAYRRLEERGLVVSRARSGFYVASGPGPGRLSRHRFQLEELFTSLAGEIRRRTNLSTVGALRYLTHLAEIRAQEAPEVAFVECTPTQAAGHAHEIETRLGLPCAPLSLPELQSGLASVPLEVRTLLVSGFHVAELQALERDHDRIASVPIEVASDLFGEEGGSVDEAFVLESDETEAHDILDDVRALTGAPPLAARVVKDVDGALAELLAGRDRTLALLSPRLWGAAAPRWRAHPRVREVAFRIQESAWPAIADAIGLPLGAFG